MSTRAPFTSDEDSYLVKYIAKYNPTRKGRAGNALYQRLCEDADKKWKWSRTHTWQSWRDRYYKNAEEFDKKIEVYQKKHAISGEAPANPTKMKASVANPVKEEEEEDEDEQPAIPGKRKRGPVEERKRAKTKRSPEHRQERKVSEGREQDTFVMGKGTAMAHRRDVDLDAQSKSRPRPTSSDEDRGEVSKIVVANGDGEHGQVEKVQVSLVDEPRNGIDRAQIEHSSPRSLYPDITKVPAPQLSSNSLDPSLPGGYNDKRPSTSHVVRRQRQADSQPEASTSKVQLSPSHRIPRDSSVAFQPRRKPHTKNEEFFDSGPVTPSPPDRAESARPKHRLPMFVEGPFGSRFHAQETRSSDDSPTEEEAKTKTWPPRRKRNTSLKGKGKAKEVVQDHKARAEDFATMQKPNETIDGRTGQGRIQAQAPPAARQPAQVNAQASSSHSAPPHHTLSEVKTLKTLGHVMRPGQPKSPLRTSKPPMIQSTKESIRKSASALRISALSRGASGATIPANLEPSLSIAEQKLPRTVLPRTSWTPGDPFIAHPARASSDIKSRAGVQNLFSRRHTIDSTHDVQNQNTAGRRVDLRTEMAKRLQSRSSSAHRRAHSVTTTASHSPLSSSYPTPSATSSAARRRSSLLPIPVADEDRERIEYLGVSKAIEMIAKNFGFRDEDVWNAWKVFKNIARTEDFFRRFREKAKAVEAAVLEEMEKDGVDFDALLVEQEGQSADMPPKPQHGKHREKEGNERVTSAPSASDGRSPGRATQERELKIKPLPVERALSEYTPPYMSRAGQYVRLVKQGRKEEAISRENRRASGGSGVFPRLRSQSAAQESPQHQTPDTRSDAERDDKRREMGDEGGYNQAPEEIVDEGALEEGLLRKEEEMAFLTATPGKAAELRIIEQRMDVDYMLRWTAAQLGRFAQSRDRNMSPSRSPGVAGGE